MPFERVHMDLIGPIGNSEKGYKYCLVLINVLTRYRCSGIRLWLSHLVTKIECNIPDEGVRVHYIV